MKKYIKYLKYLIKHKWYVMLECFKHGLYWRGIIHDNSKFLPSEFITYSRFFYGDNKSTGVDKSFDFAWLLHQKRNDHHWQWWILPEDDGGVKKIPMSNDSLIEMICDWVGAGKAQGIYSPPDDIYKETRTWYNKNKHKIKLNDDTKRKVESILNVS